MQKLKFINGNGVEIDLTDKVNFGIIAWEGFSADGLNIQSQQVPFQDGGVFLDALMEQRELSVTVAINAKGDLEKRYRLRRELISVLNPKLGEGVLIYTDNYLSKSSACGTALYWVSVQERCCFASVTLRRPCGWMSRSWRPVCASLLLVCLVLQYPLV